MGIESKHPFYERAEGQWARVRDSFNGADAIKGKGSAYLPRLSGSDTEKYEAYKHRAMFLNGIERTVKGLIGAVMRVEPIIELPAQAEAWLDDITGTGVSVDDFIEHMLSEQLLTGRQGVLLTATKNDRIYLGTPQSR
jgi:hypothetical protein